MTVALGIVALLVSIAAVIFAWRAASAAARSAESAESAERRARTPQLAILLDNPAPAPVDRVIYRVRNDGPQDLDSLVIHRPRPTDQITYQVAVTGRGGWADDVDLGPLELTREARFTLSCAGGEDLPEFHVRVECRSGLDHWEMTRLLPPPRGAPRPVPTADVRSVVEAIRPLFQEVVASGGERTPYFLDEQRKWAGQRVRDVADWVDDALLRQRLTWVADSWDHAFAKAPPEQGPRAYSPPDYGSEVYRREDEEHARRLGEVADAANKGLGECREALSRLGELERFAAN